MTLKCRYCEQSAQLVRYGDAEYPYRGDYGPLWACVPCAAWVGCHPGTETPLGRLADAELRAAKQAAHAAFDPIWRRQIAAEGCTKSHARKAAFTWLAEQLGQPVKKTHIGFMDLEECRRVVEICAAPTRRSNATTSTPELT